MRKRGDEIGSREARRRELAARGGVLQRQLEEQREKIRKEGMSRGPGGCQRAVMAALQSAPGGTLTRGQLEDALVQQGFSGSNVLRAIRGLKRRWLIQLQEGPDLDKSTVSLPPPPTPVSDEMIARLLAELEKQT